MTTIVEATMPDTSDSDLLGAIRDLARDYDVYGELGRREDGEVWFLARGAAGAVGAVGAVGAAEALVALRLRRVGVDEWGDPRYEFGVARHLGSDSPARATYCSMCGSKLRTYARFCTQCGSDQSRGLQAGRSPAERRELLGRVRAATADRYDVLGEMPQSEGGADLYFALERSSGALVRLRLRDAGEAMTVTETQVGMALDTTVTATPVRPPVGRRPSLRSPTVESPPARPPIVRRRPRGAAALGVTLEPRGPAPAPDLARPAAIRSPAPRPINRRERQLIRAAIGLGLAALIEVALLLVR